MIEDSYDLVVSKLPLGRASRPQLAERLLEHEFAQRLKVVGSNTARIRTGAGRSLQDGGAERLRRLRRHRSGVAEGVRRNRFNPNINAGAAIDRIVKQET